MYMNINLCTHKYLQLYAYAHVITLLFSKDILELISTKYIYLNENQVFCKQMSVFYGIWGKTPYFNL